MAKKAAPKAAAPKAAEKSGKVKAATKAEIYTALADKTKLSKKQVAAIFDAYIDWTKKQLAKKGPGVALLPGLGKIKAVYKPATKETLKDNPFKPGEKMVVKAKPARTNVKIVALKAYKDAL
jgi:nucleoid DNA-binding protein